MPSKQYFVRVITCVCKGIYIAASPFILPVISFFWPLLIAVLLLAYVGKEISDIRKGGRIKDSLEDIAFVFSGVLLGLSTDFNAHMFTILTAINVGCLWVMYKEHNNG